MRRSIIFLLLSTVILRSLSSSELSATSPNLPVSNIYNSLLPPPLPPEPDVALVAALDGTIHLVDAKLGKLQWSFATDRPIYSSYQASFNNSSEFYIDVGEDWELYFHSKRFGKMKKLSLSAEEYIKRMPYISDDGGVTLGAMKTTVFLVDAKSGRVVDNYAVEFPASTLGFQSDENKPVVPVNGSEELVESGLGNLKTVRQLVYITRTDYVLQSTSADSGEVLWNVAYADIKAEFRCQELGKSFSDHHFNSGSDLRMDSIGDVQSPLPCQPHMRASVYRLRDNSLPEFLSIIGKVGGWISLPDSSLNPLLGPVDRKLPLPLPDKVDRPPLALPSTETEKPWTFGMLDGSFSETSNRHTFAEGFRSQIQSFIALFISLCFIIGSLFYRSKRDKLNKQTEDPIIKTGIPKKKKSRRPGYNKSTTSSEKMHNLTPNETIVGDTNGLSRIKGNGEKFSPTFTDLIDGCIYGRRIGKLVVSNKEIAKGSNGTVVLEGNYEGRAVAVKRLVKTHHDVALKEIQNLIASDQHPNIVRWHGVESDQDFVYLSLERCTCSLHDLIYVLSGSFEDQLNAKVHDSSLLNEVSIRLLPVMENTKNVELWKANGHPSAQLLKLMRDIVSGLSHLHEIGLIHRDLKPQNVLIIKDKSLCAKLSDMGISKRLQGDMSSLTQSASGYGSSGWQAPEQLLQGRQTRAVDLFGLGCILFFCITGGKHPFGESFERDANIVKDQKDLFLVEHIPEAVDIFTLLLDPNPDLRPKAQNILYHPFFWTSDTKLTFLRDVSDRVELEDRDSDSKLLNALEGIAPVALNGRWDEKLEAKFIDNIGRYRRYKYDSIRDLLRVIRNKSNHYRELPGDIQELLGSHPEGFYSINTTMASPLQLFTLLLPLLVLLFLSPPQNVAGIGINYGTLGSNLPSPKKVAQLLRSTLIDKVKIYDSNPDILQAFANTGIDLIVAVENHHVSNISTGTASADDWLSSRVLPFIPATSIVAIVVGNEYLTTTTDHKLNPKDLIQAMQNMHEALLTRGLGRKIKVTTPHSMAVLASSFPPSASTFAPDITPTMSSVLGFLADTGAPFMVNAYPYFAYRDNPSSVDLEYALLGNASGVHDPKGYVYTNMLDAQIDAVRAAISDLGFGNRSIKITVSESGWPSKGDFGDSAATPEHAKTYNTRLIERAQSNKGTPMRVKENIEVFVFALFNENKKEGGVSERNFGIFNGDGSKVYEVDLSCQFCSDGMTFEKISSGVSRGPSVWCVAKPHADEKVLQTVLDFCCGSGGVDCREIIDKNGDCFEPEKLHAHSSYAMNAYYQIHGRNYWNCDFKGTGLVTFSDPSYGTCRYPQQ